MIEFRIDLIPRGQGRPRIGRKFGSKFASAFKHDDDVAAEANLAACAARYRPATILSGPIALTVLAVMPRAEGLSKVSKRDGSPLQDPGRRWCTAKPDGDNLLKTCGDALKSWFTDDKIIVRWQIEKQIAAVGESPHYMIRIDELPELHSGWQPTPRPIKPPKVKKPRAIKGKLLQAVTLANELF